MNILVTGGAGFIGSYLIDILIEAGHTVSCVDNLIIGNTNAISNHFDNPKFSFYEQDICEWDKLEKIFTDHKFSRVYHLAANSDIMKGGHEPSIDLHNTFETTVNILNAMRTHNVQEMLFASTSAVYGDKKELLKEDAGDLRPVSYYGGAKLASEALISAYAAMNGLRISIVRFPNVVGPRLTHGAVYDFIKKLRKNPKELEILGDGQQEKPYLHVSDLIEAMLSMKYIPGIDVFNVGVSTVTTVTRIADIVCEEMALKNVAYHYTGGALGWDGDIAKFQYDLSKIHATGWKAKFTSDEAVRLSARSNI